MAGELEQAGLCGRVGHLGLVEVAEGGKGGVVEHGAAGGLVGHDGEHEVGGVVDRGEVEGELGVPLGWG